jgi:hypothetical protein
MKYIRLETIPNYGSRNYAGLLDARRTGLFMDLSEYPIRMVGEEKSI